MRIHPIKLINSFFILSGICISKLSAQVMKTDTSKFIAAISKKVVDYKNSIIPSNIIFPASLEDHREQSLEYIEKYSDAKRDFLLRTYETGKKFFPKVISVLKRYQLPEELKVLIALESGFSGNAVSKSGAVGYWQMMARVAREYGLQIAPQSNTSAPSAKRDDRMNFAKSTVAAVKYLQKLSIKNDLLLMVASYNCGPGNINRAIKKSHKADPSFWDIKNFLPKETRNYVLNFIALNVIFNNYENFQKRQLLFSPKLVSIPFQTTDYNAASVAPVGLD